MNQIDSVWSSDDEEEASESYRLYNQQQSLLGDGWSHGFTAYDWSHYLGGKVVPGHQDDGAQGGQEDDRISCNSGHSNCAFLVHEPKLEVVRHFTLDNWRRMGDSLSHNPGLKCVDFSNCGLGAASADALFGPASSIPAPFGPGRRNYDRCAVEKLTLAHNPLGPRGVEALLPFLRARPRLKYLSLSSCHIGAEGARMLAGALDHAVVDYLHVRDCDIGDEGAEGILAAENSAQFMELCIVENDLGPRGYAAVRRFLRRTDTAMKKLMTNCTEAEDATGILDSLANNGSLQDIFLWGGAGRDNESIKGAAPALRRLVCGGTSLASVANSNHQMKWIGLNTDLILAAHPAIRKGLDINARALYGASRTKIVRNKLREFYFRGEFDVHPFAALDANVMPHVLELATKTEVCEGKGEGYLKFGSGTYRDARSETVDGAYRLVRNCHMPELFGFRTRGTTKATPSDSSMEEEAGSDDAPPSDAMDCSARSGRSEGTEPSGSTENPSPHKRRKSER